MSNKHLEPVSTSLSQIVKGIEGGIYCIPKFQRKFVWSNNDIESLGDSFLRGYPVSSVLTMPTNGNLKISAKPLNLMDQESFTGGGSQEKYVLDGQQRLTSVGRIYCDLDDKNQYFYDMLSMLLEQYPNDGIEYTAFFKAKKSQISENLCRSFKKIQKGTVTEKQGNRFISCKRVVDGRFATIINKFVGGFRDIEIDDAEKYTDYLNQQFGQLSSYAIQEQRLDAGAELGLVCRVFEKVNSTGKKLTAFDLINAKSFETNIERYKSGLADYITTTLEDKGRYDGGVYNSCKILFELEPQKDGASEYQNLGRIARIVFLAELLKNNQAPLMVNNKMLMKDANFWFEKFDENIDAIIGSVKKFYTMGILKFMPLAFIEYIIAVVCSDDRILDNDLFFDVVRNYGFKRAIDGSNFCKSDIDVVLGFKKYSGDLILANGFNKYDIASKPTSSIIISENMIDRAKIGNNVYNVIYHIMTKLNHNGKFKRDVSGKYLSTVGSYDQHHIIPKATVKGKGVLFNTICNIMPLNSITNRDEIKDMNFEDYRDRLVKIHGVETTKELFDNNLIPFSMGDVDYDEFLSARKKMIVNYISDFFNGNDE